MRLPIVAILCLTPSYVQAQRTCSNSQCLAACYAGCNSYSGTDYIKCRAACYAYCHIPNNDQCWGNCFEAIPNFPWLCQTLAIVRTADATPGGFGLTFNPGTGFVSGSGIATSAQPIAAPCYTSPPTTHCAPATYCAPVSSCCPAPCSAQPACGGGGYGGRRRFRGRRRYRFCR